MTDAPVANKYGLGDSYAGGRQSAPVLARVMPSLYFYTRICLGPVRWLFYKASKGQCDDAAWVRGSAWCADVLEDAGGRIEIEGLSNIDAVAGPCVFIANHMSTLETFLLPSIIRPRKRVTFVVKESLVKMPLFGPVMRSRDPITVGRVNPRDDLAAVLSGGCDRLKKGISIVVFPQSTRSPDFNPHLFNSIGVKLARKAGVPAIPVALKTDAWGTGSKIKELGKIRPDLPARFKFGAPIEIGGNGKEEQSQICQFIGKTLAGWQEKDGVNS